MSSNKPRLLHRAAAGARFTRMRAVAFELSALICQEASAAQALWLLDGDGVVRARLALPTPGTWSLPLPAEPGEQALVVAASGREEEGGAWVLDRDGVVVSWASVALPGEPHGFILRGDRLWLLCPRHVVCAPLLPPAPPLWHRSASPQVCVPCEPNPAWWMAQAVEGERLAVAGATRFVREHHHYRSSRLHIFDLGSGAELSALEWEFEATSGGLLAHGAYWRPTSDGLWRVAPGGAAERVVEGAFYSVARTPRGVLASRWDGYVLVAASGEERTRLVIDLPGYRLHAAAGAVLIEQHQGIAALTFDEGVPCIDPPLIASAAMSGIPSHVRLPDGAVALCYSDQLLIQPPGGPTRYIGLRHPSVLSGLHDALLLTPDAQSAVPPPADYNSFTGESSESPAEAEARFRAFEAIAEVRLLTPCGSARAALPAYPAGTAPCPARRTYYAGDSTGDDAVALGRGVLYQPRATPGELWLWAPKARRRA